MLVLGTQAGGSLLRAFGLGCHIAALQAARMLDGHGGEAAVYVDGFAGDEAAGVGGDEKE